MEQIHDQRIAYGVVAACYKLEKKNKCRVMFLIESSLSIGEYKTYLNGYILVLSRIEETVEYIIKNMAQ